MKQLLLALILVSNLSSSTATASLCGKTLTKIVSKAVVAGACLFGGTGCAQFSTSHFHSEAREAQEWEDTGDALFYRQQGFEFVYNQAERVLRRLEEKTYLDEEAILYLLKLRNGFFRMQNFLLPAQIEADYLQQKGDPRAHERFTVKSWPGLNQIYGAPRYEVAEAKWCLLLCGSWFYVVPEVIVVGAHDMALGWERLDRRLLDENTALRRLVLRMHHMEKRLGVHRRTRPVFSLDQRRSLRFIDRNDFEQSVELLFGPQTHVRFARVTDIRTAHVETALELIRSPNEAAKENRDLLLQNILEFSQAEISDTAAATIADPDSEVVQSDRFVALATYGRLSQMVNRRMGGETKTHLLNAIQNPNTLSEASHRAALVLEAYALVGDRHGGAVLHRFADALVELGDLRAANTVLDLAQVSESLQAPSPERQASLGRIATKESWLATKANVPAVLSAPPRYLEEYVRVISEGMTHHDLMFNWPENARSALLYIFGESDNVVFALLAAEYVPGATDLIYQNLFGPQGAVNVLSNTTLYGYQLSAARMFKSRGIRFDSHDERFLGNFHEYAKLFDQESTISPEEGRARVVAEFLVKIRSEGIAIDNNRIALLVPFLLQFSSGSQDNRKFAQQIFGILGPAAREFVPYLEASLFSYYENEAIDTPNPYGLYALKPLLRVLGYQE